MIIFLKHAGPEAGAPYLPVFPDDKTLLHLKQSFACLLRAGFLGAGEILQRQDAETRRIAGLDCLGNGRISIFVRFSLAPGFSRVTLGNMKNSAVSTAFRRRDNPLKRVWHLGDRPHPAEAGC
jgi:hypothetical protein